MKIFSVAFLLWFKSSSSSIAAAAATDGEECIVDNDGSQICHPIRTEAEGANEGDATEKSKRNPSQCNLYMAESSIPGAGWGVYTGKDLKVGEDVGHDIIVNIMDYRQNFLMSQLFSKEEARQWKNTVGEKMDKDDDCVEWAFRGECESNPVYVGENCPRACAVRSSAFDVLKLLSPVTNKESEKDCKEWASEGECENNYAFMIKNCAERCLIHKYNIKLDHNDLVHTPYHYIWEGHTTISTYEADEIDSLSPGVGALCNAHPALNNVDMRMPSIDTLGLHRSTDVGVGAFSDRHNHGFSAKQDIPAGMEIFLTYGDDWFQGREEELGPIPLERHYQEADDIIKKFFADIDGKDDAEAISKYELMRNSNKEVNVKMALPETFEGAKESLTKGTALMGTPDVIRSKGWLDENGLCLDNLRYDKSSIVQAGRGAFANRDLEKGQLIAPMPLIQVDRNRVRNFSKIVEINAQLLLNYSYGHRNSSMLLMPYSSVVNFVNNNEDKSKVNAQVQWSAESLQNKLWAEDNVSDILDREYTGLMLDLVATAEINEGDEIFLDYGSNWDQAWKEHVDSWRGVGSIEDFVPIEHYNAEKIVRTVDEQKSDPYTTNALTTVWLFSDGIKIRDSVRYNWTDPRFSFDLTGSLSVYPSFPMPCKVLKRYETESAGTEDKFQYEISIKGNFDIFFYDVPREAIQFVYKEYTSNQHIPTAFRHEIEIPDEIFPDKWKDL